MMKWRWIKTKVRRQKNFMISSDCERPLLILSMAVRLSECMRITFLDHSCPQRSVVIMTGWSLERAEEGERKESSHSYIEGKPSSATVVSRPTDCAFFICLL